MERDIRNFFDSVGSFFSAADNIPWCDRDIIAGCEREVAEAENGGSEADKNESIMRLSWALVHSRQPEDVQRGIAMLEVSVNSMIKPESAQKKREALYLLAVGHYRSGDYPRSRQYIEKCLEISSDWRQAINLKKVVEDKISKDGIIGMGIAATAVGVVGVVVGGIALLARKK